MGQLLIFCTCVKSQFKRTCPLDEIESTLFLVRIFIYIPYLLCKKLLTLHTILSDLPITPSGITGPVYFELTSADYSSLLLYGIVNNDM